MIDIYIKNGYDFDRQVIVYCFYSVRETSPGEVMPLGRFVV